MTSSDRRERLRWLNDAVHYHAGSLRRFVGSPEERERIRRTYQFALLRRLTPSAAVERDGIRYYVSTNDQGIGRDTYIEGSYDGDVMARALHLAEEAVGRRPLLADRTFVDVGASIGTSSIPALLRYGAARAVAFEPVPSTYELLQANLAANGLLDRAVAHPIALSDHNGTGEMELAPGDSGDNRVRVGSGPEPQDPAPRRRQAVFNDDESTRSTIPIRLARFDDVAAELGIDVEHVGLFWVDAQGHEAHVLDGARSVIERGIPVLIEYWPYGLRRADGLDRLHTLIAESFDLVLDVRATDGAPDVDPSALASFAERFPGRHDFTDLLLVRRSAP